MSSTVYCVSDGVKGVAVANDRRPHVSQIKSKIILFGNKRAFSRYIVERACITTFRTLNCVCVCVCVKTDVSFFLAMTRAHFILMPKLSEICACRTLLTALNTHHTAITFPNFSILDTVRATRIAFTRVSATSSIIRLFAVLRREVKLNDAVLNKKRKKRRYEYRLSVLCMYAMLN